MSVMLLPLKSLIGNTKRLNVSLKAASLEQLKKSIIKDGLLNPLIVIKYKNKYKVVDGHKRLSILRKLSKCRDFTRSLYKIPCIIEAAITQSAFEKHQPVLMTEPELAHAILNELNRGTSKSYIAQRFDCALSKIKDVESLSALNPKIMKCFNDKSISLAQAAAFATIPNKTAQWNLLLQLGPFLSDNDIIKAIKRGETVLELPDDNILIVPSRTPSNHILRPTPQLKAFKTNKRHTDILETAGALTHRLAA